MKIMLAEDETSTRRGIAAFLQSEGHQVQEAPDGKAAWAHCQGQAFDLVVTDVRMPEMGGLELLARLRESARPVPVIVITAFATVEEAVRAVREGAEDYLTKPLNLDELSVKIRRLEWKLSMLQENRQLKDRLNRLEFPEMIGVSKSMRDIQRAIQRVAGDPDIGVMIYGESGTGKELVARTIHGRSQRAARPFVDINCAAFSDELLESELFGYRKGAFTGAFRDKEGIFQAAHSGSLFLDEVSEMSPRMQSKLLRVLQERVIQPVGGTTRVPVDVRIIGASNQDLLKMVGEGKFREDLYYRLNVVEIHLPPLRERRDDVPLLVQHFHARFASGRPTPLRFAPEAHDLLVRYDWPGNVRELENLVRMLLVTHEGEVVTGDSLPEKFRGPAAPGPGSWESFCEIRDFKTALASLQARFEVEFLTRHLRANGGNISRTAASIGLSRVALHQKINQHGLAADS